MIIVDSLENTEEEIRDVFEKLLNEYFNPDVNLPSQNNDNEIDTKQTVIDLDKERNIVTEFLAKGCGCTENCQKLFSAEEILDTRTKFRNLSKNEKNCFILALLNSFLHYTEFAKSSRTKSFRERQKFEYKINADRPVCRNAFLLYYGESLERLKKSILNNGIESPMHGNKGSNPIHACSDSDRESVKLFVANFADNQGLPDPGRDVRKGKGRLRILLPSVMNYHYVHRIYEDSISMLGSRVVGHRTFVRIWQKELPHIAFNNPKTDLCVTCENFKKQLNQIAAILDEEKEKMQAKVYKEALDHLQHVKKAMGAKSR